MTLREYRKSKGLTQIEAAKICGVHRSNYVDGEKGNTRTWLFYKIMKMVFTICPDKQTALDYVDRLGGEVRNEMDETE